jgi:peptide/nickel transport system permease protein
MNFKRFAVTKYIIKRLVSLVFLLFLVSSCVFIMLHFAPGDPALLLLGAQATPDKVQELRNSLGLNDPLYVQYWKFLKNLILHGDLGRSYQSGRPVTQEIMSTLPISAQLALNGMIISSLIAIIVGVLSAIRHNSLLDNVTKIVVLAGVSMPVFWLGLVFIAIFSVWFRLLPSSGWGEVHHMILPSITIAAYPLATLTRLTRSTMLEVIRKSYIRTARSKGLSEGAVIIRHALRNALIPVVTMMGVQFAILITGSILTETVFAIPGLGRLIVIAVYARDYAIIRGAILVCAVVFGIVNLLVDLSYQFFDPRLKFGES